MPAQYLKTFAHATGNILAQFGINASVQADNVKPASEAGSYELMVIVGLTKDLRGSVVYSMSADTAKSIASTMMCGMPVSGLDEMARSAICEFANMSSGTSLCSLPSGLNVDITPPTLVIGQNMNISQANFRSVMTEIQTGLGRIELRINLCA